MRKAATLHFVFVMNICRIETIRNFMRCENKIERNFICNTNLYPPSRAF